MEYQEKKNEPNSGALFKNTYKEKGDNKPDWSGPWVNERGDDMRIGFWFRTSKAGVPYIHASVTEKTQPQQQQQPPQQFQSAPTPPPMSAEMAEAFNENDFLGDNGSF
tara:strand:+ start:408 stop:731 length:324 start_codon:yes stop_codon:yes gene_type:complete